MKVRELVEKVDAWTAFRIIQYSEVTKRIEIVGDSTIQDDIPDEILESDVDFISALGEMLVIGI